MRRWLKQIRIAQGIKQEEIADSVDISRGYYANIERGEKTVDRIEKHTLKNKNTEREVE